MKGQASSKAKQKKKVKKKPAMKSIQVCDERWCVMCDVRDVWCVMCDVWCEMCDVWYVRDVYVLCMDIVFNFLLRC